MKIILIDTNLYLDDPNIIHKLANSENKILIPLTVLKELDKHKFNKDLSYSARNAIRIISEFMNNTKERLIFDTVIYTGSADEQILHSAVANKADIATKDISMSIQAKAIGINTIVYGTILNNIFDPYIHIHMNDLYDVTDMNVFAYDDEYIEDDYQNMLILFSKTAGYELSEDSWWFVIINIDTDNNVLYANHPLQKKLIRIDNKQKYRQLTISRDVKTKALDDYQVCAIYAMIEAPNTLICGSYGSGKSLLSTAYGLAYNNNKKPLQAWLQSN